MEEARFTRFAAHAWALGWLALLAACSGRSERRVTDGHSGAPTGGAAASTGGTSPVGGTTLGGTSGTGGSPSGGAVATGGVPTTGGAPPTGGGGTGGTSDGGGTTGGEGGAGGETCTPLDDTSGGPDRCPELERLRISNMRLENVGPDGIVTVGEAFDVTAELGDVSGYGYSAYPYVDFVVMADGVGVSESGPSIFALLSCEEVSGSVHLVLGETVGPGAVISVVARAAALNQDCPDAPSAELRIVVQ